MIRALDLTPLVIDFPEVSDEERAANWRPISNWRPPITLRAE